MYDMNTLHVFIDVLVFYSVYVQLLTKLPTPASASMHLLYAQVKAAEVKSSVAECNQLAVHTSADTGQ